LVIYFYPKDNTQDVPHRRAAFSESIEDFKDLGAEVMESAVIVSIPSKILKTV
jgi:peroxiredoxin